MFVGKRMTRKVITAAPEDTLGRAAALLAENRIHRLPVVRDGALVGILSDSDIRNAALRGPAAAVPAGDRTVGEIMTRQVISVSPWDTIEDALLVLRKKRLGALPVVDEGRVVGILTKADVLETFIDTLDIEGVGAARIEVMLPRDVASVRKLAAAIGDKGFELRSLVLAPSGDRFVAFLRLATIDAAAARAALRDAGFTVAKLEDFLD